MKCEPCENGDHANCGLQTWCDCDCDPEAVVVGAAFDDAYYDPARCSYCGAAVSSGEVLCPICKALVP